MIRNNGVKWRRFIVPKQVEQVNDYLFIYNYCDKLHIYTIWKLALRGGLDGLLDWAKNMKFAV